MCSSLHKYRGRPLFNLCIPSAFQNMVDLKSTFLTLINSFIEKYICIYNTKQIKYTINIFHTLRRDTQSLSNHHCRLCWSRWWLLITAGSYKPRIHELSGKLFTQQPQFFFIISTATIYSTGIRHYRQKHKKTPTTTQMNLRSDEF